MRRLLYIPTIHDEADLGSVGAALTKKSVALSGERRWAGHQKTVHAYWQSVAAYVQSFDPTDLKVYQDGMAVDGDLGRRIVQEAAKRGSRNYKLVLELLDKGAELRATESPALLLQERENILTALSAESGAEGGRPLRARPKTVARGLVPRSAPAESGAGQARALRDAGFSAAPPEDHRSRRSQLLAERDRFIAETIAATLREGEIGVLFIGADHNVASLLPADVLVEMVKDPRAVAAYVHALLDEHRNTSLEELARYLGSPS